MRKAKWILLLCMFNHAQWAVAEDAKQPVDTFAQVGENIAAAFNSGDAHRLGEQYDFHELGLRALKTMGINDGESSEFGKGFLKGFEGKGAATYLARTVDSIARSKGSAKFIRVANQDGERRVLVRFDLGENGFDYAEFLVRQQKSGEYRIVDSFVLSQGQLLSVVLGAAARLMSDPNPTVLEMLFGVHSFDKNVLGQILALNELERNGKFKEAIAALDRMPKEISGSKLFMQKRVSYANMTQDVPLYREALAKLAASYGDDPTTSFLLIDYYFYQGDLDKALHGVSLMESRVGVDGVTEQLRATLYFSKAMYNEGFAHARESIRLEPDRQDMYWLLALNYIHAGQFKNAITIYQMVEKRFDYPLDSAGFKDKPEMKVFVASPEFKKWVRGK